MTARIAEQCYTAREVSKLLRVPARRISGLVEAGHMPAAALQVPGGGHKGRRWLASQLAEVCARWDVGTVLPR